MFGVPLSDLHGKCLSRLEFQLAHPKIDKKPKNVYFGIFFTSSKIWGNLKRTLNGNFWPLKCSAISLGKIFWKSDMFVLH